MAINVQESTSQTNPPFTNILIQVHFEDPQEVAKKETGLALAKKIYEQQWSNNKDLNFFVGRAAHQIEIEKWSLGKQDMMQFLPMLGVNDATKAEVDIDMTPTMVGAQFSATLVESLSKNVEYPSVKAVDEDSLDEKENRMMEAIFRMKEVHTINAAQQASGVQLEPSNVYVPDSPISAKVYFELKDQLPKEIRFQKILSKVLLDNQYERVLKPKLTRNNVVFNLECTKVGRGANPKEYILRQAIPRNTFYNFFQSDSGKTELSYIGEGYNLKVREVRKNFSKSDTNPFGLDEQGLYDFAKKSMQSNPVTPMGFNFQFGQQFSQYQGNTPWDDFSGFVIDFEIKVSQSKYWVSKTDSFGKENISEKKGVPKPTSEKSQIIKKDEDVVYRCVYAPFAQMILFWGKAEIKDDFSYTINIPYNNGEYIPSLFERAMEPLKSLALIKLKKKLLIARLRPTAFRIDVESARNIITGNGRTYEWEEILRIYTLTGVELYSSKGLNPLENSNPAISAGSRDETLQTIIALDQAEQNIISEIRVLLGAPVYLDGSNVGQRTAGKLAEGQRESSSNVTGFIQNSHSQVMEETLNKICLMAWQDVVTDKKETDDDLINTKFKTFVKMRITDDEKMLLEQDIARWSQPQANGEPLLTPADCYAIRQIDDIKLAEMYLVDKVEENKRKAIQDSERLQAQNQQVQQASAQQAAAAQKEMQADKLDFEKQIEEFRATKQKELALVQGFMAAAGKDETGKLMQLFMPALQQLVPNITLPLQIENQQIQQGIQQQAMAAQQQAMQQQSQEQQESQQGMQEQPQQEQGNETDEQQQQQQQPDPSQQQPQQSPQQMQ